jgi:hypothetical protein
MSLLSNATRRLILALARSVGSKIVDAETGRVLGRAFLIPWRGKIAVIGLDAEVKPVFLPQKRLTFWKHELGFTVQTPPDFPHAARPQHPPDPPAR